MNEQPETTHFDVNLPKPRTHKVLIGVLVTVLVLGVIGVAAAAIANRTAQPQGDAIAAIMPPNTMAYFSLNTHADQLPDFNAVANAWKDSKEAKMLTSGLELAFTQSGLNWESDIQPWLGDRIGMGIVDLGSMNNVTTTAVPFFVIAAQTKDRTKSDAIMLDLIKQARSDTSSGQTSATETYRGVAIVYLNPDSTSAPAGAMATVNDVLVLTPTGDQMKAVINAALDGQNLAASANYAAVMNTLPAQNAGGFYIDMPRYMDMYFKMLAAEQQRMGDVFDNIYTNVYSNTNATPDPNMQKQLQDRQSQREAARALQEKQLEQMREAMKSMGGMGAAMSYEPTGIRFDAAMQYDPAQMSAAQRQVYESALTPASGQLFAALPASAIMAVDLNLKGGFLKTMLDPEVLATQLASLGVTKEDITTKLDEFQKLTGVNLQTDVIDLLDGDAGFAIMPRDQQKTDAMSYSMPIEVALLLDSSNASKLTDSFDRLMHSLSALSPNGGVKVQSLSGLPYSVIMLDDKPALAYGTIGDRLVIGTDSSTLQGIANANQASLANDTTFKQATGLLAGNRLNTFYLNFQSLWNLIDAQMPQSDTTDTGSTAVFNYLKHFKWLSSGTEAPASGLSHGTLHIGVGQ